MEVKSCPLNPRTAKTPPKTKAEIKKIFDEVPIKSKKNVQKWRSAKNPENVIIIKPSKEWPKPMSTIESFKFDVIHYSNRFKNFAKKCLQRLK